jgi:hypothetical protein
MSKIEASEKVLERIIEIMKDYRRWQYYEERNES